MRAWVIEKIGPFDGKNLVLREMPEPFIHEDEILIQVLACGVCHTELDELEGRAQPTFLPIVPGHQIVGKIVALGERVSRFKVGDYVGAGWIWSSCGSCSFCQRGFENLCPEFKGTGKDVHGGYGEYFKIKEAYAFKLPTYATYEFLAPLFCAGSIGYRALKLTHLTDGEPLGLIGFGASNHLVLQVAKYLYPHSPVYVFARNPQERELALALGADFAGDIGDPPPTPLQALIDTTPVWKPPFYMLRYLQPGGKLIINAIRKEDKDRNFLLELAYERDLWLEKEIKTVANITKQDIEEFLKLAEKMQLRPEIEIYSFEEATKALKDLKDRKIRGAKVLKVSS
ncbi:MAG: zinc-dependent alcohol dehydrogenase family protein [Caldimicrobium sp.]|nr:zinc-dependent alcohol dehydrogenase family protein [Caldimicrobium sp.]MCX7874455.1 zinc-dependent alcohol dehydrogenase family protein [Caldimicrobium sp.]MDW8094109.1 zinc-dependent alcohol dehydrogenase family protein [Caldimicrobium sp.]